MIALLARDDFYEFENCGPTTIFDRP